MDEVFAKAYLQDGDLQDRQFDVLKRMLHDLQKHGCMPTHYVVLDTTIQTSLDRIKKRDRPMERKV